LEEKENKILYCHTKNIDNLVHSIDMLHIEFLTAIGSGNNEKNNKAIKNRIFSILNDCDVCVKDLKSGLVQNGTYIENIEPNLAKAKYYNYQSMISYDGVTVLIGRFFRKIELHHNDEEKNVLYDCESCVRLIYNPNKHHKKEYLQRLKAYFSSDIFIGRIIKCDYAIDIDGLVPDFISVETRKTKSTTKDTQYYGKRSRHGHIKIYNKSKEIGIQDKKITRIEITYKIGQALQNDCFYIPILCAKIEDDFSSLPPTSQTYILSINEIKRCGGNWKNIYDRLPYRTRKKIEPFVTGYNEQFYIDENILFDLLNLYAYEYNITQRFDIVNNISEDEFDFDLGF